MAGWVATESGRQPWIVEDILRTADATSPVPGASIAVTLVLFVLAYGVVFSFGIYYINRLIAAGRSRQRSARSISPPARSPPPMAAARRCDSRGLTSWNGIFP